MKRLIARASAIKGGLFFRKQNDIYHRFTVINRAFLKCYLQYKGRKFFKKLGSGCRMTVLCTTFAQNMSDCCITVPVSRSFFAKRNSCPLL